MDPLAATLLLFGALLLGVMFGFPVAWVLGGVSSIFLVATGGIDTLSAVPLKVFQGMYSFTLSCVPLFIWMGLMLERSGIAEELYDTIYKWLGVIRGGLAMGTVIICAIFAACTGITGAATVTMSYIALPSMLKRGYKKTIAIGTVASAGALGILIPPSMDFIIIGLFGNTSIGALFAGGLFSGLTLAGVYMIYILTRSYFQKDLAPSVPPEERATWMQRWVSLRGVLLPMVLVILVLGSIFTGAATPTEAAGIGALGSVVCAGIKRRLNFTMFKEATIRAFRVSIMVMWMIFGGYTFVSATGMAGSGPLISDFLLGMPGGKWAVVISIFSLFFWLGFIVPTGGLRMVTAPIFSPLMDTLGFSRVWFWVCMVIITETCFITPPFGFNLFYMKAVTPEIDKSITTGDIYRSVFPYVACILVALVIICIFPGIATWFPRQIGLPA
jgi:tripartite ATP-independent transporter DctM subunit